MLEKYFPNFISFNDKSEFETAFIHKIFNPFLYIPLKKKNIQLIFDECDLFKLSKKSRQIYNAADLITVPTLSLKKYILETFGPEYGYKDIKVTYDICEYNFIKDFPSYGENVFALGGIFNVLKMDKYKDKLPNSIIYTHFNHSFMEKLKNIGLPIKMWNWETIIKDASGCKCSAIIYDPYLRKYKSCNRVLLSLWLGLPALVERNPQTEYFINTYPNYVKDIETNTPESFPKNINQNELREISKNCKYGYKNAIKTWGKIFLKRDNSKKRKVIYTVLIGKKTKPLKKAPQFKGWDTIAIVDDITIDSKGWTLRPLEKIPTKIENDNSRKRSRYPKMNPHLYFKDYDISVYIDTSVEILKDPIEIINLYPNEDWIALKHPNRKSVQEEFGTCLQLKYATFSDCFQLIQKYKKSEFKEITTLTENSFIIRHHNEQEIIEVNEKWWEEYRNSTTVRDQLIFPLILWETLYQPKILEKNELHMRK